MQSSHIAMELDMGLQQGFRLGGLAVRPLQGELHTPQGVHRLSKTAVALLIKLAEAPQQVVPEALLCERLQLNPVQLSQYFSQLQQSFGEYAQHYLRQTSPGYELLTDVQIDVPPVPTLEQIRNGGI
ncbi:MAG: hypothetical protein QM808_15665 [Steroidobacteraceae bacterium]